MFTFTISSGEFAHDGQVLGHGYSGDPAHKNDPAYEPLRDEGPIPEGRYCIGAAEDTATHGPHVMELWALPGVQLYGRSGFLIHGDSMEHPGAASHGCIVLCRTIRDYISDSGDHSLQVLA
jgi:hypothetical protein